MTVQAGARRVAAIVLAAGQGRRFGPEPKLQAVFSGKPLLLHAVTSALMSQARPVVVVVGAHAEATQKLLAGLDVGTAQNPNFASGLASSLRAGLAALPAATEAAIVVLGDMPRIEARHLDGLIAAFVAAEPPPAAVVPVHRGRRGNPALLHLPRLAAEIAELRGDRGLGPLLARRTDVLEVEMDAAVLHDVDTPEALAAI